MKVSLFKEGLGFFVRRGALRQFQFCLTPEFIISPFGLSRLFPKFVRTNLYLLFRRL